MATAIKRPVSMPVIGSDVDVALVALILNLIAANAAMPSPRSISFWSTEHPDAEIAFRAFHAANPKAFALEDRRPIGNGLYITRVADYHTVATLYMGAPEVTP